MAIYLPMRPRWNPRGTVVNYVSGGRLCVRSWPRRYRDANTEAQRRQRGKMAQVCDALPYIKTLLAEGYTPLEKSNGRRVGAYHVAVSTALREWFDKTPRGDAFNAAKIRLTDGVRALPEGMAAERVGDELRVEWHGGAARRGAKLLFAARARGAGEWVSSAVALESWAKGVAFSLPAHWVDRHVEVWLAFVGAGGQVKTQTRYLALPPVSAGAAPGAAGRGGFISVELSRLARKGALELRGGRSSQKRPNACRFGLPWHSCVVKRE